MRRISRHSTRLATTSQARCSSLPRQRIEQQCRAFHVSKQRSSDPRIPGASDGSTPVSPWRQSQKKVDDATEAQEQNGEQESGEGRNGSEVRKPAVRRTLRQRRVADVPKPPPIPDWFLRQNVKLVEEWVENTEEVSTQTINCVDTETGHVLFSLEHYQPEQKETGQGAKQKPKKSSKSTSAATAEQALVEAKSALAEKKTALEGNFFLQKSPGAESKTAGDEQQAPAKSLGSLFIPPVAEDRFFKGWQMDPLKWSFLEAETSIRAAFAMADNMQPSTTFATDRVDLSLQCPDQNANKQMDEFVFDLAHITNSDIIQLDANDFAELTDEYVGQGDDMPGSFSNLGYEVFDGYATSSVGNKLSPFQSRMEEEEENEENEEEEAEEDEDRRGSTGGLPGLLNIGDIKKLLSGNAERILKGPLRVGFLPASFMRTMNDGGVRSLKPVLGAGASESTRDDARLTALFDNLLGAASEKRLASDRFNVTSAPTIPSFVSESADASASWSQVVRANRAVSFLWLPATAKMLLEQLGSIFRSIDDPTKLPYQLVAAPSPSTNTSAETSSTRQTIVYVRDLRDIYDSKLGETIIRRLVRAVRKRRRGGDRIVIVGATVQDVAGPFAMPGEPADDFPFRAISVLPAMSMAESGDLFDHAIPIGEQLLDHSSYTRILEINLRHTQSMLRRMRPEDDVDVCSATARKQLAMSGTHFLAERVLSHDQVHRLALGAVGLAEQHAKADKVSAVHVALAAFITNRADHVERGFSLVQERQKLKKLVSDSKSGEKKSGEHNASPGQARIDRVKKSCNQHESRLLTGVVDSQKIRTGFDDVHAPPETIEALKTLTSLSLLRPDAFKYGVLANDRLPGLLLYGPPGTGKTLLAKAVAKESQATVMEVSGAQIYEKYVGEGEKMVRAVFSLAKKLSPCIVFIDEADAIFGSRSNAGNRNTHREIINQFLREWDGMDDHGVFMMVASNRPFDLDDAVLRRLPRRLLVDLPVAKDRESILGIHLRHELLDSGVSLSKLAEQTPFYSGSDLKNLAVSAALACVREENELAETKKDDKEFKLPEKRTLAPRHFDKALAEISASISEDMSSLTAIRKFDEQFGDRKGRRKKTGYGFGTMDGVVDESAVRVRGSPTRPSAP